jgi:hypothetical protein
VPRRSGSGRLTSGVDALGEALLVDVERLGRDVAETVWAAVPAYPASGLVPFEQVEASCVAEVRAALEALQGVPVDARGARATGRRRAEQGMPLADVVSAYRHGCTRIWAILVTQARARGVPDGALVEAATTVWDAQAAFTEALTIGYRDVVAERALLHEEEASALVGALLLGRDVERLTLWETSEALGLDRSAPMAVVVAEPVEVGRHPLPGIRDALRAADFRSAWRLTSDDQTGIVSIPRTASLDRLVALLRGRATGRVGISPVQPKLSDAPAAQRLARIAMLSATSASPVAVFGEDVIGVASVASDLFGQLSRGVLAGLDDLSADERSLLLLTFQTWVDHGGSATEAAGVLYCHPNTVRYRLRKLEERTGRSVSDPRSMLELLLAAEADQRRPAG